MLKFPQCRTQICQDPRQKNQTASLRCRRRPHRRQTFFFPIQTAGGEIVVEAKGFTAGWCGHLHSPDRGIKSASSPGVILKLSHYALVICGWSTFIRAVVDKLKIFREILVRRTDASEVGCRGRRDRSSGHAQLWFAVAVAKLAAKSRSRRLQTPHAGGDGALAMFTEFILRAQGKWKQAVETYIRNENRRTGTWQIGNWLLARQNQKFQTENLADGKSGRRILIAKRLRAPVSQNKNPPAVCLGRARVDNRWATVSPYSPCCFQE